MSWHEAANCLRQARRPCAELRALRAAAGAPAAAVAAALADEAAPEHAGGGALLFPQFCEALVRVAALYGAGKRGWAACRGGTLKRRRAACGPLNVGGNAAQLLATCCSMPDRAGT